MVSARAMQTGPSCIKKNCTDIFKQLEPITLSVKCKKGASKVVE